MGNEASLERRNYFGSIYIPLMTKLFEPLTLRSLTLRNRLVVSPMCQYSSQDGFANDWHMVHLGSRAVGRPAIVFTEATAVVPEGRISPEDLGIWKDDHIEMLSRIVRFIDSQGSIAGMQLAHAGFKASTRSPWLGGGSVEVKDGGWRPVYAPSAIAFNEGWIVPEALDHAKIRRVIDAFVAAAKRALAAGFKIIELHAAHGYLLHEFLSPLTNKRLDKYGGSFENRTRIVRELVEAVRSVWPERLPLFMRVSATDWVEGGWTPEETVELAKLVRSLGVDLMDCSTGGIAPNVRIPIGPGYQVPFARKVRHEGGMPTGAVGMINEAKQADGIIQKGDADVVLMARQFLRDPYVSLHAAKELGVEAEWPLQYQRAK
jgi:2,4-dienoyl-CoA reductase-like NADH-dependent reductase (Old Yellow Enzyme family)